MNKKNIFLIVAIIIVLIIYFSTGSKKEESVENEVNMPTEEVEVVGEVTPQYVEERMVNSENVIVLDVRRQDEWDDGHVAGAVLFPVEKIDAGEYPDFSKDSEIYVYCRSGNRAGRAEQTLEGVGFTNITNIGGFQGWVDAGGGFELSRSDLDNLN